MNNGDKFINFTNNVYEIGNKQNFLKIANNVYEKHFIHVVLRPFGTTQSTFF